MSKSSTPNIDRLTTLASPRTSKEVDISLPKGPDWPRPLASEAFHGIAGQIVRAIEPNTESDPVALLLQFLISFGSAIGRSAYYEVEADRHYLNLFGVLVGNSSKGRKGTAKSHINRLFETVDLNWARNCVSSGLSSGEGLIWAVRDPVERMQRGGEDGDGAFKPVVMDPGVVDKRLCVQESEFASVLKMLERDGNKLSALIRDAWDRGEMRSLTKNDSVKATHAHISIIGHITKTELLRYLTQTETANGFGNRFLWVCVQRSKVLPFGGEGIRLESLTPSLAASIAFGRAGGRIQLNQESRAIWGELYRMLGRDIPGLLGAMTARAEPQVLRLASIYAVLDRTSEIRPEHLEAATAIWEYCEASCRFIFGDSTGDKTADRILDELRVRPAGMTQTEIHGDIFQRNRSAGEIGRAMATLAKYGFVMSRTEPSEGRPAQRWFALGENERTKNDFDELTTHPNGLNSSHSLNSSSYQPAAEVQP